VVFIVGDKAKVLIGDPGRPVSTGVRGRQSIVPSSTDLSAFDHDMNTTSLTPSVISDCKIPGTVGESFVRGKVTAFVNDTYSHHPPFDTQPNWERFWKTMIKHQLSY